MQRLRIRPGETVCRTLWGFLCEFFKKNRNQFERVSAKEGEGARYHGGEGAQATGQGAAFLGNWVSFWKGLGSRGGVEHGWNQRVIRGSSDMFINICYIRESLRVNSLAKRKPWVPRIFTQFEPCSLLQLFPISTSTPALPASSQLHACKN